MTRIVLDHLRTHSLRHDPRTRAKPTGCDPAGRFSACSVGASSKTPSPAMACRTDRYVPNSRAGRSWGIQRSLRASSTDLSAYQSRTKIRCVWRIPPNGGTSCQGNDRIGEVLAIKAQRRLIYGTAPLNSTTRFMTTGSPGSTTAYGSNQLVSIALMSASKSLRSFLSRFSSWRL
jgi:hypothetical protein